MNTFEKCQNIRRMIINRSAEVMVYNSWSDSFAAKQLRDFPKELNSTENGCKYFDIDPCDLTEPEMSDLGFGFWQAGNPMRLIPLWLYPFLAEEFPTECIDGETALMKKSELNTDSRFGCLAYGVLPKTN